MCACVCVSVCVGGKYVQVHMHVCVRGGACMHAWRCVRACAWTVPMFLTNPPIQADINAIDCNWAVMCGI